MHVYSVFDGFVGGLIFPSLLQSDREPLSSFLSEKLKEIILVNGVRDSPEPRVPVAVS